MPKQIIDRDIVSALSAKGIDANVILRRALKVGDEDWVCGGVVFPAGTYFRTWYKDRPYWGIVRNGALYIKDQAYHSPSKAAVSFTKRPTNGWDIWECMFPHTAHWVRIRDIRKHNTPDEPPTTKDDDGDLF